jgi:hypothetical protein
VRGQIGKVDCRISSPLWCLYGDASTRVGETDGDVTEAADGVGGCGCFWAGGGGGGGGGPANSSWFVSPGPVVALFHGG